MNILKDILNILIAHKNKEHMLKIVVDYAGVTVYLDYDPDKEFSEQCVIPIRYDATVGFCYIPENEFKEHYNTNDCGIELNEVILIKEIMEYFERNASEIDTLCNLYDIENREEIENFGK